MRGAASPAGEECSGGEGGQHEPGVEGRESEHRLQEERDHEDESELAEPDDQDSDVAVAEGRDPEEREVDEHRPSRERPAPLDEDEPCEGEHAEREGERDEG